MQCLLFPVASPIPDDAKPIPGFDYDYLITRDGEVWSTKWNGPRTLEQFEGGGGPRVCLTRHGRRYRPDVRTLLRRTFGIEKQPTGDAALRRYVLEAYGDDPEVLEWADQLTG